MAREIQPGKKSYFFEKGYIDVLNTVKGAWSRNTASVIEYKDKLMESVNDRYQGKIKYFFKLIMNALAVISVLVFGSAITLIVSVVNIAFLIILMVIVYIGFSIVWAVDRLYLFRNEIFTACHECKEKSLIPTYICPNCEAKHTNLTPGVYGILNRTCVGDDPDSYCGEVLPTTFFNGRRDLEAVCPHCDTSLMDREAVPICIPIVGGRSVGKTAFITAFSKEFIDDVAPSKEWNIEFYNDEKEDIFGEITEDYLQGSTRMTARPQDIDKASSVSFSFFIDGDGFKRERLVHVYDIAGEVFTDNVENEMQKQYEYSHGMVLMIDPFSIPSVRHRSEGQLTPEDIAGIGEADINEIVDSFLNKLREVTGLNDKKMSSVPLAVVIGKIDSAGLVNEIGDAATTETMAANPEIFTDYYDTQDYLSREFLKDNGMESFINNVNLKFKDNRYFSTTAIGHTRDQGEYNPKGVMAPMQWLFSKADSNMASQWNDIQFNRKVMEKNTVSKKLELL